MDQHRCDGTAQWATGVTRVLAMSVVLTTTTTAAATVEPKHATPCRITANGPGLGRPLACAVTTPAAAQDAAAVEEALGLSRPTRRSIQQGLRTEGFDPGPPDGLFGPRTRAAVRAWQVAREHAVTGYLDRDQVAALLAAAAPRTVPASDARDISPTVTTASDVAATRTGTVQAGAGSPDLSEAEDTTASPPVVAEVVAPALSEAAPSLAVAETTNVATSAGAVDCEAWNTREFFRAATAADVSACLAEGSDPKARDGDGWTPLHAAVWWSGSSEVVRTLLAAGADLNARSDRGRSPLSMSMSMLRNQRATIFLPILVEALVVAGTNPTVRDDRGATHLHYVAAGHADPAATETLLAAGADVGAQTEDGDTPLHRAAAYNRNPLVIEALLAAGADVAARDNFDRTPLHEAAESNENPAVAEILLEAGAPVAARDQLNNTPLHSAASIEFDGNLAVLEVLLAAGADVATHGFIGYTPLHEAAANENPAFVEVLLAAGADVAARNREGGTPLHTAAVVNENPAVLEVLLAAGADVVARDNYGDTALLRAARSGKHPAILEVLLAAGADVTARSNRGGAYQPGDTPLHSAARDQRDPAFVELLLAAGADVAVRNDRGNTPLHRAALINEVAVIESLLAAGAAIAARNDRGDTPLHVAAQYNETAVIESLLAAGANLETRNRQGRTPLHSAADYHGRGSAIQTLIAAGADAHRRDEDGNTPLHIASRYSNRFFRERIHPENERHAGDAIDALLDAGANPTARNSAGETPWDVARNNEALQRSDAYWRLNDARFEEPPEDTLRRPRPGPPRRQGAAPSGPQRIGGPVCEIPGFPSPTNVQRLGLSWCASTVGFQRRAFALQAAGAWCAITEETSSSPQQVNARHREINAACDALDALGTRGGPSCNCPAGYRP